MVRFIHGELDMGDDAGAFRARLIQRGAEELEAIYNSVLNRHMRATAGS